MGLIVYSSPLSAPARMVLLLAKHMDLPLEVRTLDIMKGEQLKEEFVEINAQHAVPTLVDNQFVLTESRAILKYLQNKYGKDDSLYPKVPQERAVVDQRLFFDVSTLHIRFDEAHFPVMGGKAPEPEKMAKLDEAVGYVELFLKDGYIAGSELTIADFSLAATLSTIAACGYDFSKFPRVTGYLRKLKSTLKGWDEVNQPGADMVGQFYKGALAKLEAS